jgi:Chalcone isomerase-like
MPRLSTPSSLLALIAALTAMLLAGPAVAQNFDTAGVRYERTLQLGGSTLQLNGAGVRYRFVVKVYAAGLYLSTKASTPEAALAAAGPKRVHVVMLRDIDANELGRLFTKAMQDNTPREEFAKSINGTLRMGEIFAAKKRLASGESFSVDWVPGQGTSILVNGRAQGEPVKEPEFFTALLRIWLGPNPPDARLKEALLGVEPARPGSGN